MAGRTSVWVDKDRRTSLGHKLVLSVNANLDKRGWTQGDRNKAVRRVIAELHPEYKSWTPEALRLAYYKAQRFPPPEEARWVSVLEKWGISAEKARELVDRLIAVTTAAHKRTYLGQLFDYVGRRRMYTRPRKVEWLRREADNIQANPLYWPLAQRRERPDINAERILTVLRRAPRNRATNSHIAAVTGMKLRTVETLLYSMRQSNEVTPVGHGKHALPAAGIRLYVRPSIAILNALKDGPATPGELRIRIRKSEGQIAGALHWLWRHEKIVRVRPGLWALPGTARPHIFARDAIIEGLQSGSKTVPELIAATGKNRGEIWAALRRLKAEHSIIEAYLIRPGHRGYLAAFALARH
jgi:hypothetical protein